MKIETHHIYYCAGVASDASGHRFFECLRDDRRPRAQSGFGHSLLLYLLHVTLGATQLHISNRLSVSRDRIQAAVKDVEQMRQRLPLIDEAVNIAGREVQAAFPTQRIT